MEQATALRQRNGSGRLACGAARQPQAAEGGQSLVEFALMLPLMCLLLLGVVEIGRAAFYSIRVGNAATAGVEYGSQNPSTASDTTGMTTAAKNDANLSSMTANATWGCTCDTGAGTSCTKPAPPPSSCGNACAGQVVECVQVTTTVTFSPLFHYPRLPSSFTANGNAVMRVRK
jgi:Flp pilus assembly protein TadG